LGKWQNGFKELVLLRAATEKTITVLFVHDNNISRTKAVVAHRCPSDLQGKSLAVAFHARGYFHVLGLGLGQTLAYLDECRAKMAPSSK
jgi:hypothetical protein